MNYTSFQHQLPVVKLKQDSSVVLDLRRYPTSVLTPSEMAELKKKAKISVVIGDFISIPIYLSDKLLDKIVSEYNLKEKDGVVSFQVGNLRDIPDYDEQGEIYDEINFARSRFEKTKKLRKDVMAPITSPVSKPTKLDETKTLKTHLLVRQEPTSNIVICMGAWRRVNLATFIIFDEKDFKYIEPIDETEEFKLMQS